LARPASSGAGRACALSAALVAGLLIASCGPGDNDPGPGGVTVGEARALDEAAEMLDAQQAPDAPAEDRPGEPVATDR
jgi:hypothetical protein